MKSIKISEEQDKLIKKIISEDIEEAMLNPNAGLGNTTGVGVTLTKPDGTGFKSPSEAINANKRMDKIKGVLPTGSKVTSRFSANGEEYELSSTDRNTNSTLTESILISKRQLRSIQLKNLKENSTVIKKKDFIV